MKSIYVQLAKESIKEVFDSSFKINKINYIEKSKELLEQKASFVTLNKDKNLRGCIGSIIPSRELFEDIVRNAKMSAFNDHRFNPLSIDEFNKISIEVSILSTPHKLEYHGVDDLKSKITKNDGVILITKDNKQATFLPQVWEDLDEFDIFFAHLCQKAGCDYDCLNQNPIIYTYQVHSYK